MPAYFNDDLHTLIYKFSKAAGEAQAGPVYDPDAEAYFERVLAGSGQEVQDKEDVNNFVLGVKSLGLWNNLLVVQSFRETQNAGLGVISYNMQTSYNGTLINGPTWGPLGITFDGVDDYISISPWGQLTGRSNRTLISVSQIPTKSSSPTISYGAVTGGGLAEIMIEQSYMGYADFTTLGGTPDATGLGQLISPKMCGAVYEQGVQDQVSFYRNSSEQFSQLLTVNENTPSSDLDIGRRISSATHFEGVISAMLVLDIAITQIQFSQLYSLYKSTIGQGLGLP